MTANDARPPEDQAPAIPGHPADGPGEVQDQIRRLRQEGGTYRSIAAAAGLAPGTVHDLATGRRNPTPSTTRAIQRASGTKLTRARVDAGGTRLRLVHSGFVRPRNDTAYRSMSGGWSKVVSSIGAITVAEAS